MKRRDARTNRAMPRTLRMAWATALAVALVSQAQPASARRVRPPRVPAGLEVDAGSKAFLVGHAVGTQNYICLPSGSAFAWTLFTPQATLFDDKGKQITTHFLSPNPFENGTLRPAWQHSRDTSSVWVRLSASSSDPAYVASGSIAWFLLEVVGSGSGARGGDALTATTWIQRLNTYGGVAPATGCSVSTDVGKREFVPYSADYLFYRFTKDVV